MRLDGILDQVHGEDALAALILASYAGTGEAPDVLGEYVWYRLLQRGSLGSRATAAPVFVKDLVQAAADEMAAEVHGGPDGSPDSTAFETSPHRRFSVNQLWVYDSVIVEYEIERIRELLSQVDADMAEHAGLRSSNLLAITDALNARLMLWMLHHVRAPRMPTSITDAVYLVRDRIAAGAGARVDPGMGRLLACTPQRLAAEAKVADATVQAFIDLLGTSPGQGHLQSFDRSVWDLRARPLMVWEERVMVPAPHSLVLAVRPALEARLRTHPASRKRYDRLRAKWLEEKTLDTLRAALPLDQEYRTLRVGPSASDSPEKDGLVRVDLWALAVEVKGGGVSMSARRGTHASQDTTMRRLIHEGVDQADDLLAALQDGREVSGVSKTDGQRHPVDLGFVDRRTPLVVTLEDLGGVAAASKALFAGRDPELALPIVLTVDGLRWYANTVRLPVQLLHYFAVRERIARSSSRLLVHDEADWFTFYLANGAAGVHEWLSETAKTGIPILSRGSPERRGLPIRDLSIWTSPHESMLRHWQAEGVDGWVQASVALLDLSNDQSAQLLGRLDQARNVAARNSGIGHLTVRPVANASVALHVLVPNRTTGDFSMDQLGSWLTETAPDAVSHVVTGVPPDEPGVLRFAGIIEVQPTEPLEAPGP